MKPALTLMLLLSALILSACQATTTPERHGTPNYGWDARHGGGG
jgi:hypothetical protein